MRTKTFLSLDDLKEIIQASSLIPHVTKIESIKIRMADNTPQGGPDGVEIETDRYLRCRDRVEMDEFELGRAQGLFNDTNLTVGREIDVTTAYDDARTLVQASSELKLAVDKVKRVLGAVDKFSKAVAPIGSAAASKTK